MYRARKSSEYTNLPEDIIPGDWYLHLFHARFGKIGFIDKVMAAYKDMTVVSGGAMRGEITEILFGRRMPKNTY